MFKKNTELCDVVNRMTYKPGWKFSVKGDMINASCPIIDAHLEVKREERHPS